MSRSSKVNDRGRDSGCGESGQVSQPGRGLEPSRHVSLEPSRHVILAVRDLAVAYGSKIAVDGISFEIRQGEIFGLLGPNGAGKTSALSAIEGLITPRAGTLRLAGIDIRQHPDRARAMLGVQLQATSFPPLLTIRQLVRLYAGLYGARLSAAEITSLLQSSGLDAEAGRSSRHLSGGQRQRLALAIAVSPDPVLLLLDEPTAGLDPQSRRQLWERIEQLSRRRSSVLLTTQSMEEAQAVCHRVAIIDRGRLLATGSPADLIARFADDSRVRAVARGPATLEDVFIGLTGGEVRA
jgi:ABC-2 type transport system ATP-binding protein